MNCKVIILTSDSEFEATARTVVSTPNPQLSTAIIEAVYEAVTGVVDKFNARETAGVLNKDRLRGVIVSQGRTAREVLIDAVSTEATIHANGDVGVKQGETVSSAAELSKILGYGYNACQTALSRAKAFGESSATLRGVTFSYVTRDV